NETMAGSAEVIGKFVPLVGALAGGLVIGTLVAIAKELVDIGIHYANVGRQIQISSRQIGVSVEDMQKLRNASELAGGQVDDLAKSYKNLNEVRLAAKFGEDNQAVVLLRAAGIKGTDSPEEAHKKALAFANKIQKGPLDWQGATLRGRVLDKMGEVGAQRENTAAEQKAIADKIAGQEPVSAEKLDAIFKLRIDAMASIQQHIEEKILGWTGSVAEAFEKSSTSTDKNTEATDKNTAAILGKTMSGNPVKIDPLHPERKYFPSGGEFLDAFHWITPEEQKKSDDNDLALRGWNWLKGFWPSSPNSHGAGPGPRLQPIPPGGAPGGTSGGWTVTPTDNSKMVPIEVDGKKAWVNPKAAQAFQSILDEAKREHYDITSLGGYAASGHVPGSHHYDGTAIDINPGSNPYGPPGGPLVTDMPQALIDYAEKTPGIHWGGRFSNRKDAMHFEYHPGEVGLGPRATVGAPAGQNGKDGKITVHVTGQPLPGTSVSVQSTGPAFGPATGSANVGMVASP